VSYSPAYSRFNGGQGVKIGGGSSSYISIPKIQSSYISVSAWVYLVSTTAGGIAQSYGAETNDWGGWSLGFSGTQLSFTVNTTASTSTSASYNFSTTGSWFHVVGTYDGTNIRLYVNGSNVATTSISGTIRNPTTSYNFLGFGKAWSGDTGSSINGYIDEVAVFSRALSAQEISQYYQWATSAQKKSWYGALTAILLSLTEAVQSTDTFLKGLYRSFTEAITNSDTFTSVKVLFALFSEAVQSTDTLIKTIGKKLLEAVQNTDNLIKGIYRNFTEAITNSDTFTILKAIFITLTESIQNTASLWLNGQFIDAWWTKRIKPVITWTKRTIGSVVWNKRNKPQ
jgi:hypothetical protein